MKIDLENKSQYLDQRFGGRIFTIFCWLVFVIPVSYLVYEPTYFNKDYNFAQFTPVFYYAYEQVLSGKFPWMLPGELNIQLAQSPYYAIFSPVLFLSFLTTHFLELSPYWIVNIWAICNIFFINYLLIRFARKLEVSPIIKSSFVICAGIATFTNEFSSSWYYTLPYQALVIAKLCYWYGYLNDQKISAADERILLLVSFLAVFGGNPQLFAYTFVVEACFLLPFVNGPIIKLWLRNLLISGLLFAPYVYCYLEFWRNTWRTVHNTHSINILNFLIRAIPIQRQEGGAQPIWAIACFFLALNAPLRWANAPVMKRIAYCLATISVFFLLLACIDLSGLLGDKIAIFKVITAPMKWWFFGGVTSVMAVCIYGHYLKKSTQLYLGAFTLAMACVYLWMNVGVAAWKWGSVDYKHVDQSINIISKYAEPNSRISQVSNWRSFEANPDRNLLLNTWLVGNFGDIVFAKGYETIQSNDNVHKENIGVLKPGSVTETVLPNANIFQQLGVSGLWVNAREYEVSEFSSADYEVKYSDSFNFFAKLKRPGKIVTCEKSDCEAQIHFRTDVIEVDLEEFDSQDVISLKVTPYQKLVADSNGHPVPLFTCDDGWLCFRPLTGKSSYSIHYRDNVFIFLLIGSNALFLCLLFGLVYKTRFSSSQKNH